MLQNEQYRNLLILLEVTNKGALIVILIGAAGLDGKAIPVVITVNVLKHDTLLLFSPIF